MIHNLNIDDFLNNYWQKKPLLIRAAFPNYNSPISAEELAGLACEDLIESRVIKETKTAPKWLLEKGPFEESYFSNLPSSHWTLLIQGLNKLIPEFDDLLHEFNFIPSWRVDDLMASYAAPKGSVGPHIDQYDVFLLQATGKRKWMIAETPINKDNFENGLPLKIIKKFKAESEWVLEAGDMLYLPANVAHYGIGLEDCMTFSIGFRAPSYAELLSSFVDDQLPCLNDKLRYRDPPLQQSTHSGEISQHVVTQIQDILMSQFKDKQVIADWFSRFITEYMNEDHYPTENTLSEEQFLSKFTKNELLRRPATIRANYLTLEDGNIFLYVNGEKRKTKNEEKCWIMYFCNHNTLLYVDIKKTFSNKDSLSFLYELFKDGFLEFSNE